MKRGELVRVAIPGDYGKPRPALIIQSDAFSEHGSITVLRLTNETTDAPLFRITIEPNEDNGLQKRSQVMIDKAYTVPRGKIGQPIGRLTDREMSDVSRALALFFGFA